MKRRPPRVSEERLISVLKQLDERWIQGDTLNFHDEGLVSPGSVTHKFKVTSRFNSSLVGYVKWWSPWRQYTFWPTNSIFDKKCLREIADYCEQQTEAQRAKRK